MTHAKVLNISVLCIEPYGRFRKPLGAPGSAELGSMDQGGASVMLRRNQRKQRSKAKSLDPSAPPDKDPVMLLNEYGQKRGQAVCICFKCRLF